MSRKPNILLIMSDMQRGDCFGAFETRKVMAPHVEMLARQGTRFSACITPNPVCMPARASILTGMLPLTHGVFDNGIDLEEGMAQAGFGAQLVRQGYRTGFIGKAHFSTFETFKPTGAPECRFSSADYGEDWTGPYCGFEFVNLMTLGHLHRTRPPERPPHGQHYEYWLYGRAPGEDVVQMHRTEIAPVSGAANTWNSGLPAAWHTSTWVADRTIDYLRRQDGDTPFCLWASFPDPHHPYAPPEPWSRMYPWEEVDLPRHRELDLDRRPWWHRASLEGDPKIADERLANHRRKVSRAGRQTDTQLRHMTANYYGMISLIDHNVGRILSELRDRGMAENTVVVYTSDHGEYLGDHGLYLKGPMLYEGLLRVGLVIKGPGIPQGGVVAEPVSTLDLAATIYDYAGIERPEGAQSESLRPVVSSGAPREVAYCEWNMQASRCGVELQLRAARTRTHKLTLELISGAGELYDLELDPHEMHNAFEDPRYASVRDALERMIRERPGKVRTQFAQPVGIY